MKARIISLTLAVALLLSLWIPLASAASAPVITLNPQNAVWPEGSNASFSTEATNAADAVYHWYISHNGTVYDTEAEATAAVGFAASGFSTSAGGAILTLNGITAKADGAYVYCVVTNAAGSTTSARARITVGGTEAPPIMRLPAALTVEIGQEAKLTCIVTHPDAGNLEYIWYETTTGALEDIIAVMNESGMSFICDTSTVGTRYYVCRVKTANGGIGYSSVVPVTVKKSTPPNPFTDVKEGDWCYDAVLWAVNEGVTEGMTKTSFAPDATCTRAQTVTFLWRGYGKPAASAENPFRDVKRGDWFHDAVLWAMKMDVTKGTSDVTFSPDDTVTRAQVVTFLWRCDGSPGVSAKNPFSDVAQGEYYYEAVLWAVEKKITLGMTETTFAPDAGCTRAQIVTFLWRYLTKNESK